MTEQVLRLFPQPQEEVPLKGLYLGLDLYGNCSEAPVVYGNFLSSLDGRIALSDPTIGTSWVPQDISNPRDWRLYQELAAHADVLISSARYFRQFADGRAQDVLPPGREDDYSDVREWRLQKGMSAQPAIAILSSSLNIPLKALDKYKSRELHVFTGRAADRVRVKQLENKGVRVHFAGEGLSVGGRELVDTLAAIGFKSIYAIAGSEVFHTLLAAGVVNDLFLTQRHQILAGDHFHTMICGTELNPPSALQMVSMYYDNQPDGQSQSFIRFSCLSSMRHS